MDHTHYMQHNTMFLCSHKQQTHIHTHTNTHTHSPCSAHAPQWEGRLVGPGISANSPLPTSAPSSDATQSPSSRGHRQLIHCCRATPGGRRHPTRPTHPTHTH